jgi:citrate lyase subunit beta / citryl-CoA lyase
VDRRIKSCIMHSTANLTHEHFMKSYLFVPGDRPERFGKALNSGADQIIVDLEDSVSPLSKMQARANVVAWLTLADVAPVIRINAADSPWFEEDLSMISALPRCDVMVPKCDPAVLALVASRSVFSLIPLIETVASLMKVRESAAQPNVSRLAFGNLDFCLDSGLPSTDAELGFVRTMIVLESRYAGLPAPIDGVTVAFADSRELHKDIEIAKRFGFGAKLCIHPNQVPLVNESFRPSQAEMEWAQRVIDATDAAGDAAIALDGKMIDRPVIERARSIIAQAN